VPDSILEVIRKQKLVEVDALKHSELSSIVYEKRSFANSLKAKIKSGQPALIAEIKKASPSKGIIRENFNPVELAVAYEKAGAACLSVLTDRNFFQGSNEYLSIVRESVQLPILRKDFIIDPLQVKEAKSIGADCILIIMAMLSDAEAKNIELAANDNNLDVLIEVHNEDELTRALRNLNSQLIGINNRDLKTFTVDISTTKKLAEIIHRNHPEYLVISESGIKNYQDITAIQSYGVNGFLVGESLMEKPDVELATKKLLGYSSTHDNI